MPVQFVFENLAKMTISEIAEDYLLAREDVEAVLEFVVRSLDLPVRHGED